MSTNPFVGPQPLSGGHSVFGRDRELRELQYLLTSERIVLLYSASGAGKSSLISGKGGLRERLAKSFDVWPVTRVSTEPPFAVQNRWVWSAINGFEDGKAKEASANVSLVDYAAGRMQQDRYPLLIFDQFEEILRLDPNDASHEKYAFFAQAGELLRDSRVWALFVLREDFVTQCDPYVRMLPTHMQNRYRLSILDAANARLAIEKTAGAGGRTFTEAALKKLVDDLSAATALVEPVQLQVVCHNLCEKVPAGAPPIEVDVIEELGDVTKALRLFYENNITDIAKKTGVSERRIRDWCEHELIINETIRGQVLYDRNAPDALPESVILGLESSYLIRKDNLRGVVDRYELSHDRLIRPIQRSNAEWWNKQAPLLRTAKGWEANNYSSSYLYTGEQLAEVLAATKRADLDPLAERFLKACELAEEDRRKGERSAVELHRWITALAVLAGATAIPTAYTVAKVQSLLPPGELWRFLKWVVILAMAGGGLAALLLAWFRHRRTRMEVLARITRKFRLDVSLDPVLAQVHSSGASPAASCSEDRIPVASLDPERLRTLQFAPLWVFGITGAQDAVFTNAELRTLRSFLRNAGASNTRTGFVYRTLTREWRRLMEEFLADQRSALQGLRECAAVLSGVMSVEAEELHASLVELARSILRCSGGLTSRADAENALLVSLQEILAGKAVAIASRPPRYYRHSNVFVDFDVLAAVAAGSLSAAGLAIGYTWLQELIPVAGGSILIAFKAGLAVFAGALIALAGGLWLKGVRHSGAQLLVHLWWALVATYASLSFLGILSPFHPLQVTTGHLRDTTVVNLLGIPILIVAVLWWRGTTMQGSFCEACGVWAEDHMFGHVEPLPLTQMRPELEQGKLEKLTQLRQYHLNKPGWKDEVRTSHGSGYAVDWMRVNVHICPKCRKFCTLSVTEVRLSRTVFRNKPKTTFGTPDTRDVHSIDRLLITPDQCNALIAHFDVGEKSAEKPQ